MKTLAHTLVALVAFHHLVTVPVMQTIAPYILRQVQQAEKVTELCHTGQRQARAMRLGTIEETRDQCRARVLNLR